ncbi:MAG: hypothetical protein K9K37_04225 [Desulfocapsa sp.]|nr:hypothetical protein [Desulfocapsa sp.]
MATELLDPPFSFFDFVEDRFGDHNSLRRVFSLARSFNAKSMVLERIEACGIIAEENEDILSFYPDFLQADLLRLSFWKEKIEESVVTGLANDDLVGYVIVKNDKIESEAIDCWHVFEAVFAKYPHDHNCVPCPQTYRLTVDSCSFEIQGVLYCQQNQLNKACAQVALRSLLSRTLPEGDISYRRINQIADSVNPGFLPGEGLSVPQIRKILQDFDIGFNDVDYTDYTDEERKSLPYQKYAYAGLESGGGSLVGFRLAGRDLSAEGKHIIPIYGHTFNKDTWAPDADVVYFRIGEGVGYVPSESWTSSFLGHDDNFGPNFCIPRLYIGNDKVDYVVEIFKRGVLYGGVQAEALGLNILYSLLPSLIHSTSRWIKRLLTWTIDQRVVFRAQALSGDEYIHHLQNLRDWLGNSERQEMCDLLATELPEMVWAVEISTPQLFPANERKLGEIVLDATQRLELEDDSSLNNVFILARLPGIYLFGGDVSEGKPQFTPVSSQIQSHTELITF